MKIDILFLFTVRNKNQILILNGEFFIYLLIDLFYFNHLLYKPY